MRYETNRKTERWVTIHVDSSHNARGIIWILSISGALFTCKAVKRQLRQDKIRLRNKDTIRPIYLFC